VVEKMGVPDDAAQSSINQQRSSVDALDEATTVYLGKLLF
jgi:hypothetical protein